LDSVLNGKIAAFGLTPIDKKAYIKYLKPHEKAYKKADIDVNTSCMERNKCFIQWNISCKH